MDLPSVRTGFRTLEEAVFRNTMRWNVWTIQWPSDFFQIVLCVDVVQVSAWNKLKTCEENRSVLIFRWPMLSIVTSLGKVGGYIARR